jgi:hypothetical protein
MSRVGFENVYNEFEGMGYHVGVVLVYNNLFSLS